MMAIVTHMMAIVSSFTHMMAIVSSFTHMMAIVSSLLKITQISNLYEICFSMEDIVENNLK